MQILGFLMDFVLFMIPAFNYQYYTSPEHIKAFQTMYFLSSFFNQFGPNSVTFLVAAEVFPTPIRASAHGFSAAAGKLGALVASVLYSYIDTQTKFYVVPWFGLAGMMITLVFLPDTTGLDLKEQERRWHFIRQSKAHEYRGIAIHSRHLSLWERFRGVHKRYHPKVDYRQKIEEMRREWMAGMGQRSDGSEEKLIKSQRRSCCRGASCDSDHDSDDNDEGSEESLHRTRVHDYFSRTSPMMKAGTPTTPQYLETLPLETLEELPPPHIDSTSEKGIDDDGESSAGGSKTEERRE